MDKVLQDLCLEPVGWTVVSALALVGSASVEAAYTYS